MNFIQYFLDYTRFLHRILHLFKFFMQKFILSLHDAATNAIR